MDMKYLAWPTGVQLVIQLLAVSAIVFGECLRIVINSPPSMHLLCSVLMAGPGVPGAFLNPEVSIRLYWVWCYETLHD